MQPTFNRSKPLLIRIGVVCQFTIHTIELVFFWKLIISTLIVSVNSLLTIISLVNSVVPSVGWLANISDTYGVVILRLDDDEEF